MALIDNATMIPSGVNYYLAPVGTDAPADLSVEPGMPWVNLGHTSIDELLAASSEGGESSVLGTAQNAALRTRYERRTESFKIQLQQFDAESLKLYYGDNMVDTGVGDFKGVPADPVSTKLAFLAIIRDQDRAFSIWAPRTDILRDDDISLSSTEEFASLPISIQFLQLGTNTWNYAVTPLVP